ncbi:MAG: hypothetical protein J0H37_08465 [Hyphomicrobium denitrificans]|jgi:hypothetical protein|uniref:Uncharacterized protein n=1 Tax=Hyphomicrobium denitrificans (strain ATCC 51888 / DSM 1869 / NCIMB 11706 / TK 0415) TaxID=582899 RepID=D8JZE1_HYPDA|nr:hypothetical protein [Hyphomicrobium denitrificans]ADJ23743.1 hypothetical protein Hden_1942 [Hyphomicrobium denitrificans ATCC 51888]MBN9282269.1 hypothetical protein [Hyphomicrobium denitrificans]MBN9289945.1 hypothetical protein [Hyphomicrobium denitrificans]MBN9352989.1 hypothetical protein [Hyphomicrobium denitrificans]
MDFETNVAISAGLMVAAFVLDWPRAIVGVAFGVLGRFLPYATIVVPLGVVLISIGGEFVYPLLGRTESPSLSSFAIGLFSVAATASNLYITIRNLKDRL